MYGLRMDNTDQRRQVDTSSFHWLHSNSRFQNIGLGTESWCVHVKVSSCHYFFFDRSPFFPQNLELLFYFKTLSGYDIIPLRERNLSPNFIETHKQGLLKLMTNTFSPLRYHGQSHDTSGGICQTILKGGSVFLLTISFCKTKPVYF